MTSLLRSICGEKRCTLLFATCDETENHDEAEHIWSAKQRGGERVETENIQSYIALVCGISYGFEEEPLDRIDLSEAGQVFASSNDVTVEQ